MTISNTFLLAGLQEGYTEIVTPSFAKLEFGKKITKALYMNRNRLEIGHGVLYGMILVILVDVKELRIQPNACIM